MDEDIEDAPPPGERLTVPKKNHTALGCGCFTVVAIAVGVFIWVAGNAGEKALSSSAPATPAVTQVAAPASSPAVSPAQELAELDGDQADVADYQSALDALAPKCTQNEAFIAGLGDSGYKDLIKNGVTDETRLGVLQHLNESIPSSLGKTDCTGMLSAYLVLREQG